MKSRANRRSLGRWSSGLALSLALCAALILCGGVAAAATYEEGGGAAVKAEQAAWPWMQRKAKQRTKARRIPTRSLWNLPPSGKKPVLQKKAPAIG